MILEATAENIERAARAIQNGELVAFPTETVYGLGAKATDTNAVQQIFELKGRPNWNPLIVHLSSIEQAESIAMLDKLGPHKATFFKLAKFWPGPLSIVVPKSGAIPDNVTAGRDTVAVRIPNHPVAKALLLASNCPIAAPSANRFMSISPTCARHVENSFTKDAPLILDGGACEVGVESTVLDLTSGSPRLLRPGGLSLEALEKEIGEIEVVTSSSESTSGAASPGTSLRHYCPQTKLYFLDSLSTEDFSKKVGLLAFNKQEDKSKFSAVRELSFSGNLEEAAKNLFSALRELDALELDLIAVERCEEKEIGRALMDRLRRATTN